MNRKLDRFERAKERYERKINDQIEQAFQQQVWEVQETNYQKARRKCS